MNRLDRFFEISERGSSVGAEARGGLVTFIAMAYIIVLNPIILSGTEDVAGNTLQFAAVSAVTALVAAVMTVLFGLITRLPFAFAAGLGINSFLATAVVGVVTWPEAMGLVVINGLIIVALAVSGLRRLVFDAVPMQLKIAITAGIGLFILSSDWSIWASCPVPAWGPHPSDWATKARGRSPASPPRCSSSPCSPGCWWPAGVRGAILLGLLSGTVLAVVIESIWHLGPAKDHPGGGSCPSRNSPARRSRCPICPCSATSASVASAGSAPWPRRH